ncbi:response regulator [Pseudomonas yamanorum]|uniref:response regulator n=1 Tax=Pseudomonas yamanorum TaxID=515393 RepID=UPI003D36097F
MPLRVLVVEDDEIVRPLMVEALLLLGLDSIECATGDEALKVLNARPNVSLVITDVRMPGDIDGLQLSRLIWTQWPDLPVVIVSGNTVLPPGFLPENARFLPKPCSLDALHKTVNVLLGLK